MRQIMNLNGKRVGVYKSMRKVYKELEGSVDGLVDMALPNKPSFNHHIELPRVVLKTLMQLVNTKEIREQLQFIMLKNLDGHTYAFSTNGHAMFKIELPYMEFCDTEWLICGDAVTNALKETKGDTVPVSLGRMSCKVGDIVSCMRGEYSPKYPDVKRVIRTICTDPYLRTTGKALKSQVEPLKKELKAKLKEAKLITPGLRHRPCVRITASGLEQKPFIVESQTPLQGDTALNLDYFELMYMLDEANIFESIGLDMVATGYISGHHVYLLVMGMREM